MTKHNYIRHINDNSVNIRNPDTINIHEHKAPTDESIRYAEDMYQKVLDSLIAKVEVKDNIVNGEAYAFSMLNRIEPKIHLRFLFKINGNDFDIQRNIEERDFVYDREKMTLIEYINNSLKDWAKAVLLWYTLKNFTAMAYENITKSPLPDGIMKELVK